MSTEYGGGRQDKMFRAEDRGTEARGVRYQISEKRQTVEQGKAEHKQARKKVACSRFNTRAARRNTTSCRNSSYLASWAAAAGMCSLRLMRLGNRPDALRTVRIGLPRGEAKGKPHACFQLRTWPGQAPGRARGLERLPASGPASAGPSRVRDVDNDKAVPVHLAVRTVWLFLVFPGLLAA